MFNPTSGYASARVPPVNHLPDFFVIYQKAPYAIFSLRSGANVTKLEQLENLEIASGAGSFTQKVIEAFMKSKGLKADTVKYTNIDPAARIGMLVAKKIPAIETFAMSMPGVVKAAGGAEAQIFLLANAGLSLYSNGILVREDYLKAEPAKVKAFVKASLQGWKDAIANPKEAADMRATDAILKGPAEATGGSVHWLADGGVPVTRRVDPGASASGSHWIGLKRNNAYRVTSVEQTALLPPWLALILLLGTLLLAWRVEGR